MDGAWPNGIFKALVPKMGPSAPKSKMLGPPPVWGKKIGASFVELTFGHFTRNAPKHSR